MVVSKKRPLLKQGTPYPKSNRSLNYSVVRLDGFRSMASDPKVRRLSTFAIMTSFYINIKYDFGLYQYLRNKYCKRFPSHNISLDFL